MLPEKVDACRANLSENAANDISLGAGRTGGKLETLKCIG